MYIYRERERYTYICWGDLTRGPAPCLRYSASCVSGCCITRRDLNRMAGYIVIRLNLSKQHMVYYCYYYMLLLLLLLLLQLLLLLSLQLLVLLSSLLFVLQPHAPNKQTNKQTSDTSDGAAVPLLVPGSSMRR